MYRPFPHYYSHCYSSPDYGHIPTTHQKVVSIPIQFVDSSPKRSRSDSAVKIQKVFRGFMVRKSAKKIFAIERQVNAIAERISLKESVDLLRRDSTERLKVNETLMSLLLELDSVRGVDSGIRDCRKAVIRKAIALQDKVDAVVHVASQSRPDYAENVGDASHHQKMEKQEENAPAAAAAAAAAAEEAGAEAEAEHSNVACETQENVEAGDVATSVSECAESVGTSNTQGEADSSAKPDPSLVNEEEDDGDNGNDNLLEKKGNMTMEIEEGDELKEEDKKKRSRELLERMMEDNQKMKGLMAELLDRNEMQTRLLSSLSQRVDQLERAFMCEKLRRKNSKKKKTATTDPAALGLVADCLDFTPHSNIKTGNNKG